MAEYVYKCQDCNHEFILSMGMFQKVSEIFCPKCRSKKITKKFQPLGLVFKGSGFYSTDNRKNK